MQIQFYFVDVFADHPLTGNPLAIVPHAESLTDEMMRRIAGELNQAETTFILPSKNAAGDARPRSFTAPGHEVFGAGHNSLGAWWWLAASGELKLRDGSNYFMQEIGDSVLPVEVRCQGRDLAAVVLTQSPPEFDKVCAELPELAAAFRLETEDILRTLPAQVVSTGVGHLLVPVRSLAAIGRARPDAERLARVLKSADGKGCYLYCLDTVSPSSITCKILQPYHGNRGGLGHWNRSRPPGLPIGQPRDCQGRFHTHDRARMRRFIKLIPVSLPTTR